MSWHLKSTTIIYIIILNIVAGSDKSILSNDFVVPSKLSLEIDTDQGQFMQPTILPTLTLRSSNLFLSGFTSSMAMILATEIGDKTFFIAALLSMRNSRTIVFTGAYMALFFMTILSMILGLILPTFIPREYVNFIGSLLFLYFGIKLVCDSRSMQNVVSEDLEEVEGKLLYSHKKNECTSSHRVDHTDIESGNAEKCAPNYINNSIREYTCCLGYIQNISAIRNKISYRVFAQSLILTFFAEWGDRSQIATIALAASKDPIGVTVGACAGHFFCTGMAVIGGRILASRISEKSVSLWGGITFLFFGLHPILQNIFHF